MATPYQVLLESFRRLNKRQLTNFRWHLDHKTLVLCGDDADMFAKVTGGA